MPISICPKAGFHTGFFAGEMGTEEFGMSSWFLVSLPEMNGSSFEDIFMFFHDIMQS